MENTKRVLSVFLVFLTAVLENRFQKQESKEQFLKTQRTSKRCSLTILICYLNFMFFYVFSENINRKPSMFSLFFHKFAV